MNTIVGKTIYFTNASDTKGKPAQWFEWDFGDGNKDSTNWDTAHIYNAVGAYTTKLIVQTECGACFPHTEQINVYDEGGITCETGGCDLLLATDVNNDGAISQTEYDVAMDDVSLTQEQKDFIHIGEINDMCVGCYGDGRAAGISPLMIAAAAVLVGAFIFMQE